MKDAAPPPALSDRDLPESSAIAKSTSQHVNWILPSIFWLPAWPFSSAQAEHLPFLFWLVDATRPRLIVDLVGGDPDVYLAFCQAVERLDYAARCTGVADIFSRRGSDRDRGALFDYHNLHFGHLSNLANDSRQSIESLGSQTVDLLYIEGKQASQFSEPEARAWLDLLSPQGLILVKQPQYLHRDWQELLKGRASCTLSGQPTLRLIAATSENDHRLSLFDEASTDAVAKSARIIFARLGSALREHGLYRDTASFATRLEISLADQSAAADLLREEKTALEGEIQRQASERDGLLARVAVLEPSIEQFRAEVIRLQQHTLQTAQENDRLQQLVHQRDLESKQENDRLQKLVHQRDLQSTQENARLQKLIHERDIQTKQETDRLQKLVTERDLEITNRNEEMRSANEYAALQHERLEQSIQSQEELRRHVAHLEHDLNAIVRSTAWRITAPFRMLGTHFPRAARLFRRGLKLLWWAVSLQLFSRLGDWRRRRQPAHMAAIASTSPRSPVPAASSAEDSEIADGLRRSLTGAEYSSTRIQYIENRIVELSSILNNERHRVDYALLGADGLLNEIELYHNARSQAEYKKAFEEPTPLVSICVATMNRSDLLVERCLKSLLSQSYRNIQIIVVGDHCTDDTGSRVARLGDDRISFRNLPARGPYPPPGIDRWRVAGTNAINAALSMCEGQFIAHLDDDDSATVDRIETMLNAAQLHKADFCWHSFWNERKDGGWHQLGDGRLELGQVTTGSIFYHRYFKKLPWDVFAYRTHEPGDWNRLRKIRSLRPNLHFVDRPLMFHYTEGSQPPFVRFDSETFLE